MTREQFRELPCGVYRIFWCDCGGTSVASIYRDRKGDCWIAPANWVGPGHESITQVENIDRVECIERAFADCDG